MTSSGTALGPYALGAMNYFENGWAPLPARGKTLLVEEFSGGYDNWPDEDQVKAWAKQYPRANIALRLPKNIIGIDVDCYKGKPGAATLAARVEEWGRLPKAWSSSSRNDGQSRIMFFRVKPGFEWPGQVGPGVDLIRWDYRYAIVCPSVHPETGANYLWTSPDGETDPDYIPAVGEI